MMQLHVKQLLNTKWCRHSWVSKTLLCLPRQGNDPSRPKRTVLPRRLKKRHTKDFFLAHSDKTSEEKSLWPLPPSSHNGNFERMSVSSSTSVHRVLSVMSFYFLAFQSCGIRNFDRNRSENLLWTIRFNYFDRGNYFILLESSSFWGRIIFSFYLMLNLSFHNFFFPVVPKQFPTSRQHPPSYFCFRYHLNNGLSSQSFVVATMYRCDSSSACLRTRTTSHSDSCCPTA